jgi:hypothetical protein
MVHSCGDCGEGMFWVECSYCDEGYSDHDCGEDTCCCLDPEDNVRCDICRGKCGWYICARCTPEAFENR